MKQIILFLSLLLTVQIGTAQETWNACNSTVTVIPAPSYDSTFVLEAPSRAALQKGMANWVPASSGGGSASYLVYTALLTQTGTSAPVATVLENTLGLSISYTYAGVGYYQIWSLNGLGYDISKIAVFTGTPHTASGSIVAYFEDDGDQYVVIQTEAGTPANNQLVNTFFEIRVYP